MQMLWEITSCSSLDHVATSMERDRSIDTQDEILGKYEEGFEAIKLDLETNVTFIKKV